MSYFRITAFYLFFPLVLYMRVNGQSTENPDLKLLKADEATILTSLLHIVDKKFDTISSRMSSLETAVNGLQFYNLRQFKIINNNLHGVNTFIQGVHGKLTQFDIGSRAVKIAVDILDQDITEFTESNKQLLEDMTKEMAAIDKSVHEKTGQIKNFVEIVEENLLEKIALANTIKKPSNTIPTRSVETSFKCDVNTTALQRQIEARFSEMRNFAHRELVQLHNVSRTVSKTQNMIRSKQLVPQNFQQETNNKINPLPQQEIKPQETSQKDDQQVECSILENERLFKALSNMTANIVQSVSYFRHTSGLFEELITNTDLMALEQSKIRKEIEGLKVNVLDQNFTSFPNDVHELPEVTSTPPPTISKPEMIIQSKKESYIVDRTCSLSMNELKNILTASKNESRLLTVVTQLVLNTSVSLSNTLIGLQDEIYKLQEMKAKSSVVPGEKHSLVTAKVLRDLVNQTKQTYKMVRMIASNTGWMPHTFQRVGSVGEQINKSLEITQHLYGDFSNIFDLKPLPERDNNKAQQVVENSLSRRAQTAYGEHYVREGNVTSLSSSPLLDLIFNTNKELKRIMPALTRLIAEPEPLFSLVNGGKENEGRLEVYYHGQWATMCGANLNNEEASTICRSLAYSGGVASPRGGYGPGSGGFRSFNKTCISSHRCPIITESRDLARCSHAEDLGIVCDHMVRVVDNDGYISRSRGRLQLYHQGKWRPVCSRGWKEGEVRTACRQLGYSGGRMFNGGEVKRGAENLFVTNIRCEKESDILHSCDNKHWMMSKCGGYLPVALVCQ